jgi:hypothetical protein
MLPVTKFMLLMIWLEGKKTGRKRQTVQKLFKKQQEEDHQ